MIKMDEKELFSFDIRGFLVLRGGALDALAAGDEAAAILASPLLRQYVRALVNPGSAEGEGVVIRTPSGCDIAEVRGERLLWPHDVVIVPAATVAGGVARNRSGVADDAPYVVFVAQLEGKRISKFATRRMPKPQASGLFNLYG